MCNSVLSRKWPHAAGVETTSQGHLWAGVRLELLLLLLLQPPSPQTLLLLNQSRFSTTAQTSQRIQQMEEKLKNI